MQIRLDDKVVRERTKNNILNRSSTNAFAKTLLNETSKRFHSLSKFDVNDILHATDRKQLHIVLLFIIIIFF